MMKGQRGFTLMELITTVSIIAATTACSFPSFANWRASTELRGTVMQFVADLRSAKLRAIKENSYVAVNFSNGSYQLFLDNGNGDGIQGNWQRENDELLLRQRTVSSQIFMQNSFSAGRMRFKGFGRNKAGRVSFVNSQGRKQSVVVSVLGRIRIE